MCVGVPMQIISVDGLAARCKAGERTEPVSLALTGPLAAGDHVLVHLGSAIRRLDEDEAHLISDALEAVAAAAEGRPFDHLLQDLIDREPQLPPGLVDQNTKEKQP